MARGKMKLTKGQRSMVPRIRSSNMLGLEADLCKLDGLASLTEMMEDYKCDHRNISRRDIVCVSNLLSETFLESFKAAVPLLFHGIVQSLQGIVIRKMVLGFLERGAEPRTISELARSKETRKDIKDELQRACEEELCEIVVRLSTENTFDLICDLASRHGYDLLLWGPPCACSFAACLGCLVGLVKQVRSTPPTPNTISKAISKTDVANAIRRSAKSFDLGDVGASAKPWIDTIAESWNGMSDIFWEAAKSINPMELIAIRNAYSEMERTDGIALWYSVVARELQAQASFFQSKGKKSCREARFDCFSGQQKNDPFAAHSTDGKNLFGHEERKMIANICKEQGNRAYEQFDMQEAVVHYTRAIGYNADEPVFPLNRAACFLKLKRFEEAEEDCSSAISRDATNYKAWFRRGVSRAGQGRIEQAAQDFKHVLELRRSDASAVEEFTTLAHNFMLNAIKKKGGSEEDVPLLPSRAALLQQQTGLASSTECSGSGGSGSRSQINQITARSIAEVHSQISFAIAFSYVVRQKTGIDVKVPIPCFQNSAARM